MRRPAPKTTKYANRYVRRFAWTRTYDWDAEEYVWLEWVHVRQYWSTAIMEWVDFHPSDEQYASWLVKEPVYDSRNQL